MSYTIMNLSETADSAPKFGLQEMGEAHFPREELNAKRTGFSYQVLKPGKRQLFGHRHEKAEEIYVVLSGSGRMRLDDEIIEISELDAIRVEPRVTRAFEAGDDGLAVLAFGAHHDKDGEVDREFWQD
ncbi:MAG TPA: cupin domain-containing protein [Solirubrobacteraceae bacterium]|jgi:mannose-6-phosphate isomerase-like protein (cupin superfamily)|nr:cupin domain-containing protein [Solirubrobacteraceae bacterium]